jgi:DNA-directed RNA polymerase subunit RPC12/RpoP
MKRTTFCPYCGQEIPLLPRVVCPSCSVKIFINEKICPIENALEIRIETIKKEGE